MINVVYENNNCKYTSGKRGILMLKQVVHTVTTVRLILNGRRSYIAPHFGLKIPFFKLHGSDT
jgi:hypothetical protein